MIIRIHYLKKIHHLLLILCFQARDPDSVSSVTYVIKEGDKELFAIDSSTGVIRTLQPLDYEKKATYTLVVGTIENDGPDSRATATVVISVEVS